MSDEGVCMLCEGLKTNSVLTKLNLSNSNYDSSKKWVTITKTIVFVKHKERLSKHTERKIGTEGSRMISEALKTNASLTELKLECMEYSFEKNKQNVIILLVLRKTNILETKEQKWLDKRWKLIHHYYHCFYAVINERK